MALDAVLRRFMEASPVSVMARLALRRAVSAEWMDASFEQHRERHYTREWLLSSAIELTPMAMKPDATPNALPGHPRAEPTSGAPPEAMRKS